MKLSLNRIFSLLLCITVICLVSSCASTSDVASSHKIQKRKYQKGFHVQKKNKGERSKLSRLEKMEPRTDNSILESLSIKESDSLLVSTFNNLGSDSEKTSRKSNSIRDSVLDGVVKKDVLIERLSNEDSVDFSEENFSTDEEPIREKNISALLVFIVTIISFFISFTGFGLILMFICCFLTIRAGPSELDGHKYSELAKIAFYVAIFTFCLGILVLGVFISFFVAFFAFTEILLHVFVIGSLLSALLSIVSFRYFIRRREEFRETH